MKTWGALFATLLWLPHGFASPPLETPWLRHTIDDTSRGADGVRLIDMDGDGRLDIATGWEEGGVVRLYRHPGKAKVTKNKYTENGRLSTAPPAAGPLPVLILPKYRYRFP